MEKADKQFFLTFLGVTGALVFLTVVVLVAANLIGGGPEEKSTAQIKMAEQRIQPVGKVNLKSNPTQPTQTVAAVAPAAAQAAPASGQAVYDATCFACHTTGAAGAPVVGNKAVWEPRIAQGTNALYTSALKGKGAMPPKGGSTTLSDEEVKAAVDYMVKQSKP